MDRMQLICDFFPISLTIWFYTRIDLIYHAFTSRDFNGFVQKDLESSKHAVNLVEPCRTGRFETIEDRFTCENQKNTCDF